MRFSPFALFLFSSLPLTAQTIFKDYRLSYTEATQVIGTPVNYFIPKIGGTKVEMAAMIPKRILLALKKYN